MPTNPTIVDSRSAIASDTATISCDLPTNTSAHLLIAFVNLYIAAPGTTSADISMTGWTAINAAGVIDSFGNEERTEAFYHAGGLQGTATATSTLGATVMNMYIFAVDNSATTPDASNIGVGSYSVSHPISSLTTTKANDLLIKFWGLQYYYGIIGTISYLTAVQAVAGATGQQVIFSPQSISSANVMVALSPYAGPSVPVLVFPNGGESLTVGAAVIITWNPSTSPTAAQSSLQYNLDYSSNNGVSWTSIVALTSAGVTSHTWTVPSTTGHGYLIRIRAYDPAILTYSLAYDQSDAAFSVIAETTPGQPIITAPSVGSVQNKAVNVTVAWTHQGGTGNPQTEFTLQWADNASFTSPTTVGPTVTTTQSTSIDFSSLTAGTTVYVKVKTKGISLYSAYSNSVSFIVASLPATPNITAPVAASPPTIPQPTITFTEADAFVARKMRITVAGIETYNSGTVVSTATSFVSPYNFANGIEVILYLSVQNSYGLWSAEDSETLTPSYTGPAAPTITLTANSDQGYISVFIVNSDTPSYNEVWRRQLGQSAAEAIQVSPSSVVVDGIFLDYGVRSGITYVYFVRAVNSGTTLFTDSADAQTSITLTQLALSIPSATLSTANASAAVSVMNHGAGPLVRQQAMNAVKLLGRTKPVPILGETISGTLSQTIVIPNTQASVYTTVLSILESGEVICARDQFRNRVFGKVGSVQITDKSEYWLISFTINQEKHDEGTTGSDVIPATVAGFIPRDIPSCILWLEADSIIGVADGGAVASWPDKSGAGNDAVQATGTKQPMLKTDMLNGLSLVRFDGGDTLVTASSLWSGADARFMFVIFNITAAGAQCSIGQSFTTTSLSAFSFETALNLNSPRIVFPDFAFSGFGDLTSSAYSACLATYDGAIVSLYATFSGVMKVNTQALTLNTVSAGFRLGSRLTTGGTVEDRYLNGDIALVVAGTGTLTNNEIEQLFAYATGRYGLP